MFVLMRINSTSFLKLHTHIFWKLLCYLFDWWGYMFQGVKHRVDCMHPQVCSLPIALFNGDFRCRAGWTAAHLSLIRRIGSTQEILWPPKVSWTLRTPLAKCLQHVLAPCWELKLYETSTRQRELGPKSDLVPGQCLIRSKSKYHVWSISESCAYARLKHV